MSIVSSLGVPTILRCWSARLTRTRRSTSQRRRMKDLLPRSTVFGAPKTHPARNRVVIGMGDREFDFDEE
eukprot:4889616-Amphidinium_carterae.1